MNFRNFIFAFCLLLFASSAFAQDSDPTLSQTPVFRAGTNLVLVPALVRTGKGELVFTLTADDFKLTDNGVEQKLSLEQDTDSQPLALVIVIQTGGAGARRLDTYRNLQPNLEAVVGAVDHKVAVVTFDSAPQLAVPFTANMDEVAGAIGGLPPGDSGGAILDGLGFAVDLLRKQPPNYRRAILLISETHDHGSQATLEDALRAIDDTNTTIYSVNFSTTRADAKHEADQFNSDLTPAPTHGCMSKDQSNGSEDHPVLGPGDKAPNRATQTYDCLALLAPPLAAAKIAFIAALEGFHRNVPETLAQLTGGEYFKFENQRGLQKSLVTISNHVPNRYVLSFSPQSPATGLHAIEVRLRDHPGLTVSARKSYWADAPASPQ